MNYSIPISNIDKVEILKLVLNCWYVRNKPFPSSYPWVSFVNLNLSNKVHNFCVRNKHKSHEGTANRLFLRIEAQGTHYPGIWPHLHVY